MSGPTLAIQATSIVLRGKFNPAIVTPGWLLSQGLLGPNEALDVHSQVIVNQLSQFHVSWFQCQVTEDSLTCTTDEPAEFERLRDVVTGTLDALPHTPVGTLGINRMFHFQMPSWDEWHAVGDSLVPKELWESVLDLPGTQMVSVQGVRSDTFAGWILITVQPSKALKAAVYVSVNDHYVLEKVEAQPETRADVRFMEGPGVVDPSSERIALAREILNTRWLNSIDSAEDAARKLLGLTKG